jgi:D-alanyl-D-alanine carboxypeptidase
LRQWHFLLASLLASLFLFSTTASASSSLASVPKYAAILVDADTHEILYARNPDEPRHPASITKVMTLYLTFEALDSGNLKLTDRVYFSRHAAAQPPSKLGVPRGGWISVEEAIRTLTTKSANDVAVALAERLAGTESAFARKMTAKAHELGMKNTAFYNASGLPNAQHHSTARDLAILSEAVIDNFPQYYAFFSQQQYNFHGRILPNHNHLLGKVVGLDGIKTGYTVASGFTLAASAHRGGKRLIAVVLGAPTSRQRNDNITALIEAGFDVLDGRRDGNARMTVAAAMSEVPQVLEPGQVLTEQGSSDDADVGGGSAKQEASR